MVEIHYKKTSFLPRKFATKKFSLEICNNFSNKYKNSLEISDEFFFVTKFVGNLRRKSFRRKTRWKFATKNFSLENSLEICDEKFFVGKFVGNFQRIFRRKIFPTNLSFSGNFLVCTIFQRI